MRPLLPLILLAAFTAPAAAVSTSYWTQTTEADFKAGTLENVVATNLGDLKLSRAIKTLLDEDPRISSVNAIAEAPDGTLYAGTGPHGVLLAVKGETVSTIATLGDDASILSLIVEKNGAVLLGTGGEAGRVLRIDKPGAKPHVLFQAEGVQYVWAMAQTPDGNLYAATGPEGQLFEIKPDGGKRMLLDSDENNLLSLISDGKDLLYVGTDPHGLVYRVNRKTGDSFVLYNAPESEISALALDKQGNLYAGTAEAKDEGGPSAPNSEEAKSGRPEGGAVGVPIPSSKPKEPAPVNPPDLNPGQPDPIPKNAAKKTSAAESRKRERPRATWAHFDQPRDIVRQAYLRATLSPWWLVSFLDAPAAKKKPHPGPNPNPNPGPGPDPNPNPNPSPKPVKPKPKPAEPQTNPAEAPGHQPEVDVAAAGEPRVEGNAIYKIDPEGFVTEVFRQPVLILAMVENNDTLLVATGASEGQIYQVRSAADETVVLAKVDAKQILSLLPARDGKIYMGMSNVGGLASMSSGFATHGTFTSPVLDATQISRFGKIHLHGTLPGGTTLSLATRSGNMKEATEKGWSKWSDKLSAAEYLQVPSPSARFLQYRLTFTSKDGKTTPVVEDVTSAYQVPNLPPQIKAVKIGVNALADAASNADGGDAPVAGPRRVESARHQTITWEAADPNNDAMQFSLYFRRAGEQQWILLKDKLTEATFDWDTRTVADGRYEIKVVASDANANPPGQGKTASRVSDPVLVDNTPPVIGDLKWQQKGNAVNVTLKAVDRSSTVAAVDCAVDSAKDWQLVLPVDGIYDSPEEAVSFSLTGLSPGQHQLTLRATDAKGNQAFENVSVTVEGPAAAR